MMTRLELWGMLKQKLKKTLIKNRKMFNRLRVKKNHPSDLIIGRLDKPRKTKSLLQGNLLSMPIILQH
jgi:hypothetical protein